MLASAFFVVSDNITFVCLVQVRQRSSMEAKSTLSGASRMCANAWMTLEELAYLNALKPRFLSKQENRNGVGAWVARTANEFLKTFPARASQFDCARLIVVRDPLSELPPSLGARGHLPSGYIVSSL